MDLVLRYPTEEVLTVEDLRSLLERGVRLRHYIGFEISGLIHLGTGLVSMAKLVDLQRAGIETQVLLADLHSWLNNKLGGDLETIRRVAVTYYREVFRKIVEVLGGDPDAVRFVLASQLYEELGDYWYAVLDLARLVSLSEAKHSLTIMGRRMGETIPMAWLVYPLMQVADIFALGAHVPHGGVDQRRAHVLAREVAHKVRFHPLTLDGERIKPVAVHHRLIPALNISTPPSSREELSELKMSKSVPHSAVFVHDEPGEVEAKIRKAYCPPRDTSFNPVLEILRLVAFREERREPLVIERPPQYGGTIEVWTWEELVRLYSEGKLHPADLKAVTARELNRLLEPIRGFVKAHLSGVVEELKQLVTR